MAALRLWLAGTLLALALAGALNSAGDMESVRRLIGAGRVDEAERIVGRILKNGADAAGLSALGDIRFQRADFDGAAMAYRAALAADERHARAYWGLGRIEFAQFHRSKARDLTAKAFGLDPRDPDIILAYYEFTSEPAARATLLRNVILLTQNSNLRRAEEAMAHLELDQRLQGAQQASLASPYQSYTISLRTFQPEGVDAAGVLVPVQINGSRILRLLLDTGARGITISARSARQMELQRVTESRIGGLGSTGPVSAALTIAKSVSIGPLRFENCVVEVTPEPLTRGADGVIAMNMFEAFEIRLDARARMLQLTPFKDQLPPTENRGVWLSQWISHDRPPAAEDSTGALAYGFRHFLLVRTKVGAREGLFLVDTGAAVTSLEREFAPPSLFNASGRSLQGVAGAVAEATRLSPLTLEIAGRSYVANDPVAMNLGEFSHSQGIRISGILGYSALNKAPVSFNYRDGLVDFEDHRQR